MFANFATAITSSTAVTLALLYVMNLLIGIQPQALVEPRERMDLTWIHAPDPEEPPDTIENKPDRKTFEPTVPPTTVAPGNQESKIGFRLPRSGPPPIGKYTGPESLVQNGPLVSLVRPHPAYPARAQQSGLEGWVLVEFDVLTNGTVTNIQVIESSDAVFERSARNAAARFRFKPRVIDGIAQVTYGIQNIFRYQMEN
jgi:protein TonB